jgi:hypothetical protein
MNNTTAKEAIRYRWIKAQRNLVIRTDSSLGTPWLSVNNTCLNGIKDFDDLVDQAMKMYPLKDQ